MMQTHDADLGVQNIKSQLQAFENVWFIVLSLPNQSRKIIAQVKNT